MNKAKSIPKLDREIRDLIVRYGDKLTDREQIDMLSEIYPKEDIKFANLMMIDEILDVKVISTWVRTLFGLRVSLRRKGRKEIIKVLKNLFSSGASSMREKTSMELKRLLEGEE